MPRALPLLILASCLSARLAASPAGAGFLAQGGGRPRCLAALLRPERGALLVLAEACRADLEPEPAAWQAQGEAPQQDHGRGAGGGGGGAEPSARQQGRERGGGGGSDLAELRAAAERLGAEASRAVLGLGRLGPALRGLVDGSGPALRELASQPKLTLHGLAARPKLALRAAAAKYGPPLEALAKGSGDALAIGTCVLGVVLVSQTRGSGVDVFLGGATGLLTFGVLGFCPCAPCRKKQRWRLGGIDLAAVRGLAQNPVLGFCLGGTIGAPRFGLGLATAWLVHDPEKITD